MYLLLNVSLNICLLMYIEKVFINRGGGGVKCEKFYSLMSNLVIFYFFVCF